jgi:hypothetical protein
MDSPDESLVAKDFVYCGKCRITGGIGQVYRAIEEDGSLGKEFVLKADRKYPKVIGGIYAGAKWSATQVMGLSASTYKGYWKIQDDLIGWKAKTEQIEVEVRIKKLENDAKRIDEIDIILAPLRKTYSNYRRIGDVAGMEALSAAVVRSLRR